MKKILLTLFVSIILLVPKSMYAFGTEFSGSGFYSSIASSIGYLEDSLYTIDLPGDVGTMEKINTIIGTKCITSDLTEQEVREVAERGNIELIYPKISAECKNGNDENAGISIPSLGMIINAINLLHTETRIMAVGKTHQLMNIDSTGIYSDGILDNSPFDLIVDIKNIDKIIFAEASEAYSDDSGGYVGTNNVDLGDKIGGLLKKVDDMKNYGTDIPGVFTDLNSDTNWTYYDLKTFTEYNSNTLSNKYQCSLNQSSNSSGLSQGALDVLVSGSNNNSSGLNGAGNSSSTYPSYDPVDGGSSGYSMVNDNAVFPCTTFFCINIDYVSHEHKMLGGSITGGNQDMAIESIVARSNEHLKKFAHSSLAPSKMTINNFELGLKDIDLTQLFHMGVQITSKPVPILNVTHNEEVNKGKDKEEEDNSSAADMFKVENQLRFYYESYGLEYARQNDLSLFQKTEVNRQVTLNSSFLDPSNPARLIEEFNKYEEQKGEQRKQMQTLIQNNTKIQVMGDLDMQFRELEVFNKSIKDYVTNLSTILKGMLEIPVATGKT